LIFELFSLILKMFGVAIFFALKFSTKRQNRPARLEKLRKTRKKQRKIRNNKEHP